MYSEQALNAIWDARDALHYDDPLYGAQDRKAWGYMAMWAATPIETEADLGGMCWLIAERLSDDPAAVAFEALRPILAAGPSTERVAAYRAFYGSRRFDGFNAHDLVLDALDGVMTYLLPRI